ncbi:MAG: hypothetical protein KF819_34400 [Labilithrix sp.]|nr:hypothetical protein [Labilithrix sp.]
MPYRAPPHADWNLPPPAKPDSRLRLLASIASVAVLAVTILAYGAASYVPMARYAVDPDPVPVGPIVYGSDGLPYVDTSWSYLHIQNADGEPIGSERVLVPLHRNRLP